MNQKKPSETFLSDWLAGTLSDAELRQLVSETDFIAYQKLRQSIDNLHIACPDIHRNYAAVKAKRIDGYDQKPSRSFAFYRYISIAAAIALLFGLFGLFIFSNTISTDFGKIAVVALNDDSLVTLNAKSRISYPNFFRYNRTIQLQGEAYFEVTKGRTFTVKTEKGNIQVLGTKFNVIARPYFFEVVCLEGSVKVCTHGKTEILFHGDAIRFYGSKFEKWQTETTRKPLWVNGESSFKNVPLQFVINEFRNQYNCEVQYPKAFDNIRFSGSFTNKNADVALQSICIPVNLKYSKTDTGKIIITE